MPCVEFIDAAMLPTISLLRHPQLMELPDVSDFVLISRLEPHEQRHDHAVYTPLAGAGPTTVNRPKTDPVRFIFGGTSNTVAHCIAMSITIRRGLRCSTGR